AAKSSTLSFCPPKGAPQKCGAHNLKNPATRDFSTGLPKILAKQEFLGKGATDRKVIATCISAGG
ncbi:MAG: hypothetical protein ILP02_00760, partial [Clostridia bacterium]|nr:hypothetical protein [Clostridia bacterium]